MKTIHLHKINSNGKKQNWHGIINGNYAEVSWWQEGGKVQMNPTTYAKGKNIGRKNEVSKEEYALQQVVKAARKKVEQGYTIDEGEDVITENTSKTVKPADLTAPKPMTANKMKEHWKKLEKYSTVFMQTKLDGNRCTINLNTGQLYSRSRKPINHLPELGKAAQEACKEVLAKGIEWVDGEITADGFDFDQLQKIVRSEKNLDPELIKNAVYNIFDVMSTEIFRERKTHLQYIEESDKIKVVLTAEIPATKEAVMKFHDECVELGDEGGMVRLPDFEYQNKKSLGLFKVKDHDDDEFECIGYESEKNNPNKLGAVKFIRENGIEFRARPRMSAERKQEIWGNQDKYLGKWGTVWYQGFGEHGRPRFPRLKHWREENDMGEK